MEHPELAILIHKSKLVSSKRSTSMRPQPWLAMHPITTLRAVAGNALVTVGTRIAPEPRPAGNRNTVGGISIAGSSDT